MLKAGVGEIDISPKKGIRLAGFPNCVRENTGVHDPLMASAIHLNNGMQKITLVCVDLLYIGKEIVKEVRSHFDYPITFTATHTHSGPCVTKPSVLDEKGGLKRDPEYIQSLKDKLVQLIQEAEKNTFSAEFATVVGHCGAEQGVGGNRREKGGLCNPAVNVLAVKEKDGDIRGILVNYALHPTFLHAENKQVTADYPAYIRRYFHFAKPQAVVMFAQGNSGNQSSRYHRIEQSFEEAARVGTTLGIEADRCLKEATFTDTLNISFQSFILDDLPLKEYPPIEVTKKAKEEAEAYYESVKDKDYITAHNAELAMFGAQHTYAYSCAAKEPSPELPMEVATIILGDTLIVQMQGEQFVEYGLHIKERSTFPKTFSFEVSNGGLPGYIYTEAEAVDGGYEIGQSRFDKTVERVLCAHLDNIIDQVCKTVK